MRFISVRRCGLRLNGNFELDASTISTTLKPTDAMCSFIVGCEAGTYIRKLCFDIGEILGVGAHMQELRRTRSGPFTENSTSKVTLHDVAYWFGEWESKKDEAILHKFIVPMEEALSLAAESCCARLSR